MMPIKDLLNKLKWDYRLTPDEYTIHYLDRVSGEFIELPYKDIRRIEGSFIIIERDFEEVNIPMHRVRKVTKNNINVWNRD